MYPRRLPRGDQSPWSKNDDLIRIDIPARTLDIIGTDSIERSVEEIEKILSERRAHWIKPESQYKKGILDIYTHNSVSPMKGAYMEFFYVSSRHKNFIMMRKNITILVSLLILSHTACSDKGQYFEESGSVFIQVTTSNTRPSKS